jgi:hypothetical protein
MNRFHVPGTVDHGPGGVLPTATRAARDELRLAVRAVLIHNAQYWPGGVYCGNDRSPFPCRMRRWGERALLSAGWTEEQIAAMVKQANGTVPPWADGDASPAC